MNTLAKWICPLAITLAGACQGANRVEGDPASAAPVPAVQLASTDDATDPLVVPTQPEDTEVDEWLARLDSLMTIPENAYDIFDKGRKQLRAFNDSLRSKLLSPEQTGRIVAYMDELLARHPEARKLIAEHRHQVENLTPGKVAPDIVGTDIDGGEFRLADYRGNIVVLFFTGEWCAPCRAAYPFQRRMLKRYRDEKVVLLGVKRPQPRDREGGQGAGGARLPNLVGRVHPGPDRNFLGGVGVADDLHPGRARRHPACEPAPGAVDRGGGRLVAGAPGGGFGPSCHVGAQGEPRYLSRPRKL